ncbi:MAG: Cof-type HAD-IIB family hydrolase [Leptolyngbyaceae bacterium]|nr:Cof-type HAD-IIB family hydrolase [Leptolyngbyaceae bacterium]
MADRQSSSGNYSFNQATDIRLLVLDIDGTIAGESNEIRPAVIDAVKAVKDKGIQVAIATGRMYRSALRFHEALELSLPIMAYQGAMMKDPRTQTVHRHWPVSQALAARLLEDLERPAQKHLLSIHFYIDDQLYVRDLTPETLEYAERSGVEPIAVGDLRTVLHRDTTKILALSSDTDLISSMLSSFRQQYTPAELYFTKSVSTFFEAANAKVNKGMAVRALAEDMLGLTAAHVMAIGDNFNDVEMLHYSGVGIAMGNAPEDVKAEADWVTDDVEADGVAIALEKFLL